MSDNPFEEDSDRTVIRPVPGGRKPAASPPPAAPRPAAASPFDAPPSQAPRPAPAPPPAYAPVGEGAERILLSGSPLMAAAAPLLQLLARLRNTSSQPNAVDLRERAAAQIRAFEAEARQGGVPEEQIAWARYALCASLDDAVLNTPWGAESAWSQNSLVNTFHREVQSGTRFFDLLKQLEQNPGVYLGLLEVMYMCLSLGFMGVHRHSPRGPAILERAREDVYTVVMRQRGAAEAGLSPHWQGVNAPYKPSRASVPVWVVGCVGLAVLAGLFALFSSGLSDASGDLFDRMMAAPPAAMPSIARVAAVVPPPPPPPPPGPGLLDKLKTFLKPEIDQKLVVVLGDESTPIVRIKGRGMFALGNATLEPKYYAILGRIGEALKQEVGPVFVYGYTDNQPIHTVRFPSNYELSAARAIAAKDVIAKALGDPGRIKAEGRADADPIGDNKTPAGQDENRRIEVVLRRQG